MSSVISETLPKFTAEALKFAAKQSERCHIVPVRLRRAIKMYLREQEATHMRRKVLSLSQSFNGIKEVNLLLPSSTSKELVEDPLKAMERSQRWKVKTAYGDVGLTYQEDQTVAYVAARMPAVYSALYRVLNEVRRRVPDFTPAKYLILGQELVQHCGEPVCFIFWAMMEVWPGSLERINLVEPSQSMQRAGQSLVKDLRKLPLIQSYDSIQSLTKDINKSCRRHDMVIASYVLGEIPSLKDRITLSRQLWDLTDDILSMARKGARRSPRAIRGLWRVPGPFGLLPSARLCEGGMGGWAIGYTKEGLQDANILLVVSIIPNRVRNVQSTSGKLNEKILVMASVHLMSPLEACLNLLHKNATKRVKIIGPIDMFFMQDAYEVMKQRKKKDGGKLFDENRKKMREYAVQKFCWWMYDGIPFNTVRANNFGPGIEAFSQFGLDGWTDTRRRRLINFLVNNPKRSKFIEFVDGSSYAHTDEKMFELLDKFVQFVGEKDVIQVVTDSASTNVLAGSFRSKIPTLYWSPCAAYCIDLMFEDIPTLKKTYERGVMINAYMYNRSPLLDFIRDFTENREMVRPAKIRCATAFLTLKRFHVQKGNLRKSRYAREA
ncbi:Methyltransferase-like protein 17, mitochondrial [Sesamum angolense]|uniref:Methyltransferase-like protein 17, mitochondrial n=1 Tax=Sesamum angolense TaxID=2727404 RepID=A0AAE1WVB9_9LAMI|nr:Methyltransferase-like protein 17, mitochondrial [Sesamum angolense]